MLKKGIEEKKEIIQGDIKKRIIKGIEKRNYTE
jgi:hypothetical protein